jgi:tetratricopeptide (TPR) repeat protein
VLLVLASALTSVVAMSRAAQAEPESWATTQAAEMTRQGDDHARRGEPETAALRYLDALRFDATYGAAYLALGSVYEATGDPKEAERAYAMGIDHIAGFAEAFRARGRLRRRLERREDALGDFEAAASFRGDDPALLRELADAYVALGRLPAALATMRRIASLADEQHDARSGTEARVRSRALALLVAEADPVGAGALRGVVRRAIAAAARRR